MKASTWMEEGAFQNVSNGFVKECCHENPFRKPMETTFQVKFKPSTKMPSLKEISNTCGIISTEGLKKKQRAKRRDDFGNLRRTTPPCQAGVGDGRRCVLGGGGSAALSPWSFVTIHRRTGRVASSPLPPTATGGLRRLEECRCRKQRGGRDWNRRCMENAEEVRVPSRLAAVFAAAALPCYGKG
nr:hypothetical protein Iba_chr06cCG13790 [Ipomoea batatas]